MKLTESNRSPRTTNTTDLSGKVAVVTGAAAGLGRAEALGLARLGATVVVNDVASALDASDVVDEIGAAAADAGAKAVAVAGDISQRATADELLASAVGLGGLDIVVNNAGITRDRMLFNMSDEEWDAVIAVHLRGHFCSPATPLPTGGTKPRMPKGDRSSAGSSTPRRRRVWWARWGRRITPPPRLASPR